MVETATNYLTMGAENEKKLLSLGVLIIVISMISGCSAAGNAYRDGKKSLEAGNYEDAAKYFSEAVKENPNRADYYIGCGMAYIGLAQMRVLSESGPLRFGSNEP